MLKEEAARDHFQLTRTNQIRVTYLLSRIKNVPTNPNDCWVSDDELSKKTIYDRPGLHSLRYFNVLKILNYLNFSQKVTDYVAARFVCQLLHKFESLHRNGLEASHYCGYGFCLFHICPESPLENKSRIPCHSFGCAAWCQHKSIPCIYQRDGHFLPCRSNSSMNKCECDRDCFVGG